MNLAEFGSWALNQGSVANPPPDNWFKGQCVSLIQQYLYRVFDKPFKAYGNAKDWANNYSKDYFTKLSANTALQKGDVLVYGSNYGGGYGHIALIDVNGKFFDQNGVKKKAVGYRDKPFVNYVCVLRPINQDKLGLNTGTNTKYVCTKNDPLNLRNAPNGTVIGSLARGTMVNVIGSDGAWSKINSPKDGWVSTEYLGDNPPSGNTVGQLRQLKANVKIWSNPDLTGNSWNYLKGTVVKIIENTSNDVDKIYVLTTGRTAYINKAWYK